jgi:hypothetical protein
MLMNPSNTINTSSTPAEVEPTARGMGLQIQIFNASTSRVVTSCFLDRLGLSETEKDD